MFALVAFNSCKKDNQPTVKQEQLAGVWKATSAAVILSQKNIVFLRDSFALSTPEWREFRADGTGTSYDNLGTVETFKYTVTANQLLTTNRHIKSAETDVNVADLKFTIKKFDRTTLGLNSVLNNDANGLVSTEDKTVYYAKQ